MSAVTDCGRLYGEWLTAHNRRAVAHEADVADDIEATYGKAEDDAFRPLALAEPVTVEDVRLQLRAYLKWLPDADTSAERLLHRIAREQRRASE